MAKRRRDAWTPEALRMGALYRALIARGETQTHIAEVLGIDQTYVSQLAKAPHGIPRGIGADLVRKVLEEYRVDPWYFYDFPADKIPNYERYVIDRGRARQLDDETRVRKKGDR